MRMTSSRLPRPLGLALLLLAGCQGPRAQGPSPASSPESPPAAPAAAPPSWRNAHVGDAATYSFAAWRGPRPKDTERMLRGQVTLEVVAVRRPWVWVGVAFADEAGQPLGNTRFAQPMLLPMRMEATRPLGTSPPGPAWGERVTAAGRDWEALRSEQDLRSDHGPLLTHLYARQPGPLYLTRGLLSARTESADFRMPGGSELALREVREGTSSEGGTVPALERPLGPGTWYDRRVQQGPAPQLQRVCLGAELGFLLRAEGPIDARLAPCANFAEAEFEPLEDVLMGLAWEVLAVNGPSVTVGAGAQETFQVEGHESRAFTVERQQDEEGVQRIYRETYAAEPWSPTLSGLAREARFQPLVESIERVEKGGKRVSESGSRLVRWGAWWDGAK